MPRSTLTQGGAHFIRFKDKLASTEIAREYRRLLHCVVIRIEPLCTSASSARLLPDAAVRCLLSASAPIFHRSGLTVLWRRGLATENRKRAEGDDVLC
jgi:hypothetical protein